MLGFSDRQGGCHGTQVATGETELLADEVMADGLTLRGNTCWLVRTSVNVVVEGFWSQFQAQLARTLWLICNVCPGCGRSIVHTTLVLLTATGVSRAESGPPKRQYPGSYQLQPGKGFSLPRLVSAPPPRSRLPCSSPIHFHEQHTSQPVFFFLTVAANTLPFIKFTGNTIPLTLEMETPVSTPFRRVREKKKLVAFFFPPRTKRHFNFSRKVAEM